MQPLRHHHITLSDLEPRFIGSACGKRGAEVRPDFASRARASVSDQVGQEHDDQERDDDGEQHGDGEEIAPRRPRPFFRAQSDYSLCARRNGAITTQTITKAILTP